MAVLTLFCVIPSHFTGYKSEHLDNDPQYGEIEIAGHRGTCPHTPQVAAPVTTLSTPAPLERDNNPPCPIPLTTLISILPALRPIRQLSV